MAWLTLDEHDADVVVVLRYVVAALQRPLPALGAAALQLLDTPQPSAEAALTLLINDMLLRRTPIVLVLDDYHRVRAPAIHQAISYLIEHQPPTLRLVLATREEPPLPLARLRARRQLHDIRAADLRFTAAEAAAYFSEVMGLALRESEIAALERRTEGWITGLQLAALALREHADRDDFIQAFTGTHRLVLDYLAEEVLANLPTHLHEFMLQTSILERLCGPLCDALLGLVAAGGRETSAPPIIAGASALPPAADAYSQLVLDQLERANLFVVPLDGQRHWYRYHHLFGAVLRQRLQHGAAPGAVAALHERASTWLATYGHLAEAADHALAAGQWPRAAQLIEQLGDSLLQSGGVERLRQLISALPPAVRDEAPQLLYLHGRCVRQMYDLPAGRTLFAQAAAAFGRAGDAAGRGKSLAMLSDCCRMLGAYADARHALAEALASPLPPAQRAVALLSLAYEAMTVDEWHAVIPTITQMLDELERAEDRQALHDVATNLTSLVAFLPGGSACIERLRRLLARQPAPPLSLLRAADLFFDGLTRLVAGDLRAAYTRFTQLTELNAQLGTLSQVSLETELWYAHCAVLCGDVAADQRLQQLMALLDQPVLALWRQQNGTFFVASQCLLDWVQGRADAVRASVAQAEASANSHEWPIIARVRHLMCALALLAEHDWPAAERELAVSYAQQRHQRASVPFGDAGLLLAYLCQQTGREAEALTLLDEALSLHEQHGTLGLALLLGAPALAPLLRLAMVRGVQLANAARLLDALPHALPADADTLTVRELEVLRLIAAGLGNPEIALRLVVSVPTVKKHINNIFAKLQAQSRTQALVRAHERGLI